MPNIFTPYDDRYRVFTWWWNGSAWIYQEQWSTATAHDSQGASASLATTRHGVAGWAKVAQPGWYYFSVYYWDDTTWVYKEGSPQYVAPMPGLSWSGEGGEAPLFTPTGEKMPSTSLDNTTTEKTSWGPFVALGIGVVITLAAILIMKEPSYER